MIKLLVVDDSALMRKLLGAVFAAEGDFELRFARNGVEALEEVKAFAPDVVTLDVHMPEMDGLACLDRIMIEKPCPVVMVSSLTEAGADATLEAMRLGAVDFVAKPNRAMSLEIDALAPHLVAKVRAAAGARLRRSLRLTERVRMRVGRAGEAHAALRHAAGAPRPRAAVRAIPSVAAAPGPVQGLVLIGTSTGGPPALEAVLSRLPGDFPWPVLVAQHMPASFTGPLARRLDGLCALDVVEVTRPMPLKGACVYIGRGDADLIVAPRPAGPVAMAAPALPDYPWHPSVDRLVVTARETVAASRIVGVLMTGMGHDGARAMTRLREEGGRTIAEAEETAVVWGMPGELVKAGGAQFVAPLDEIAEQLIEMVA